MDKGGQGMSTYKKLQYFFISAFVLFVAEFSHGEHFIEYSRHATIQEALDACSQLFYDIGADQFYNSPGCGYTYVEQGDSSIDLVDAGTPFFRITGGNWCTDLSGNFCRGDFYFFLGASPGYLLAQSAKPIDECEANPCDPISGRKMETVLDYRQPDSNLQFTRYYSSLPSIDGNTDMGSNWRHNFSAIMEHAAETRGGTMFPPVKSRQTGDPEFTCLNRWDEIRDQVFLGAFKNAATTYNNGSCLVTTASGESVTIPVYKTFQVKSTFSKPKIISSMGVVYDFVSTADGWKEANSAKVSLKKIADAWHFIDENKVRHIFVDGILSQLTYPGGEVVTLTYDENRKLVEAENNNGRVISFNYTDDRLATVNTPSGIIQYLYQDQNLVQVIYQDGSSRQYHYEDTRFLSHLTGITNENGVRYATWAYDSSGRVILSEYANGSERYEFLYSTADGTTRVTGPNGDQRTYQVIAQQGGPKVSGVTGDRCQTCPNSRYKDRSYDTNGYLASATDWNGITTSFVHDDTGLELSRTEAVGTPQERTITTEWDATHRLPTKVTTPTSVTQFTYDESGNLLTRTDSDQGL